MEGLRRPCQGVSIAAALPTSPCISHLFRVKLIGWVKRKTLSSDASGVTTKPQAGPGRKYKRVGRWLLLAAGAGLLAMSAGFSVKLNRSALRASRERALSQQVAIQSQLLQEYFDQARTVMLLSAANPAFRDFYEAPGTREDKIAAGGPLLDDVNAALADIESLYPRALSEVCFIHSSGAENARIVGSHLADPAELSIDESSSAFFATTQALKPGLVYQAAPYLSPDTNQWVISNSTPLGLADGTQAVLHFEVSLDSFREALNGSSANHTMIVNADSGDIVLDLDHPLVPGGEIGDPEDRPVPELARVEGPSGLMSVDGKRIAYQQVAVRSGNANHWLVVTESAVTDGWWQQVGIAPALMLASALFVLVFALLGWRSHNRRLSSAAVTDDLTGLPNRALLYDRINQGLRLARRNGTETAVLLIDLDRFKEVNDTLGHHKGDLLLIEVGVRLRSVLRDCDTVARLGGDEFAVFLPGLSAAAQAGITADRLLQAMTTPFSIDDMSVHIGGSIGIACSPNDGDNADTLLQHADVAMYHAKRGHLGSAYYHTEKDRNTERRLLLAGALDAAIANKQLVVNYQPKVDLATGAMAGVEALVRWQHPELGLIAPDEFISIAEDTGLIKALTMNVLDQALERSRAWKDQGCEQHIAVNLSARSLVDIGLPEAVALLLRRWGVDGSSLTFEITETAMIDDHDTATAIITALHQLGIQLSIDDFGTGYFSLSGLRNLPIDEIKIDRGFVSSMTSEEKDAFIVRSTIALGKNLGLRVVAEGVEDDAALNELRSLGCDHAQGYFMSRPLHGDQVIPWLHTWQTRHTQTWDVANTTDNLAQYLVSPTIMTESVSNTV